MKFYNFIKNNNISKSLFIVYFVFFVLTIYFISLIFFGKKGLVTYLKLRQEIVQQEITKQELINEMRAQKNKVDGMNVNSLDLDLLDEEARKNLGYSKKNEIVIYQDHEDKKENKK